MKAKQWTAWMMAFMLLTANTVPAWAALEGPGRDPAASVDPLFQDYDAETLERLQDNVIEYDEIENRIHSYNVNVSMLWKSFYDPIEDYEKGIEELKSFQRDYDESADQLISAGQLMGSPATSAIGHQMKKGYASLIHTYQKTVDNWGKSTGTRNMKDQFMKIEKQMTSQVQKLMIGYETIRQNVDTLNLLVSLQEKQVAMYDRMKGLGLATEADQIRAKKNLLDAQKNLLSLQTQQESLRRTLCGLLGYDPAADVEIRTVPEFDPNRLADVNLEIDMQKAIGSNYTLIDQRTSAAGKTTSGIEARLAVIEEGDQKVATAMQQVYQDLMDQKTAYEAAQISYQVAQANHETAKRQYQLGLVSELQYIGTEIAYCQGKAAWKTADLNLRQAMETYYWATRGLLDVE